MCKGSHGWLRGLMGALVRSRIAQDDMICARLVKKAGGGHGWSRVANED